MARQHARRGMQGFFPLELRQSRVAWDVREIQETEVEEAAVTLASAAAEPLASVVGTVLERPTALLRPQFDIGT